MADIQMRACLGGPVGDEVQLIVNNDFLKTFLGDIVSANLGTNLPGPAFNATLGLYQNGLVPDVNTTFADLVECNFTGYSRSSNLTFSTVGFDDQGNVICVADAPTPFHATASDNQTVQGAFLATAADANVAIAAGQVTPPIGITSGLLIPATVTLQMGNS